MGIWEAIIGFLAGYFSGHFGLGGGLITTPAIRIWLGQPAFIAIGTPLLVNIPTSIIGAISYSKRGFLAKRLILPLAASGMMGAIIGAGITKFVNADIILLITAVTIFFFSSRFILGRSSQRPLREDISYFNLALSGLGIGLFSGFLGLGGGFLLVPFLSLFVGLDIKTTFGTSLAVVGAITIPGAFIHYLLGHVDVMLGLYLIIGVVPGTMIGSRVAMRLPNPWLRVMFGVLLGCLACYLAIYEIMKLAS